MWDWLSTSIDPSRGHEVGLAVSWHARTMILAWGLLAPLAVLVARYFKILPWQNWPHKLDSMVWWRSHWIGQSVVLLLSFTGLAIIFDRGSESGGWVVAHHWLGSAVLLLVVAQVLLGIFRGSKGGPTAPAADGSLAGDHYDMTKWRLMFEWLHKTLGYAALTIAVAAILTGLWIVNAPRWMWLAIIAWWIALGAFSLFCQMKGWAYDTYQAIWGDDPDLPGNKRDPPGWGMNRPSNRFRGAKD